MSKPISYYMVNGISLYRMVAVPLLIWLALSNQFYLFKWLITLGFFTDAVDGYLARRFGVNSRLGAMLDSIADDLNMGAAIVGLYIFNPDFFMNERVTLLILAGLYLAQNALALIKYKQLTSFHTYMAKTAAVLQGLFVIGFFFMGEPIYWLFYIAAAVTATGLIEEIILILRLEHSQNDIKGLFWLRKTQAK
ncbi:CDP-alcohol phosphatidyltransferase family protein [Mucilaginibacter auburnensis]|uniref:CDP-diacylglycerol--glycerol-3-phosphate 3-phosphatidyltransferase n=1 Tax=Mucilaginibacter auburnensis TaxID=1457233 RepID=A0A2H9VT16_9SPHI|nr:CDP-alcohol phosphatidyltransferase family protein [Mucilaginibacter auburnensis]PJJ83932.1 CDP-diacylglycerol--glycerol-3-phosphate 3-phosphatidyltransferase [Mucilaginibacter auburnensis]